MVGMSLVRCPIVIVTKFPPTLHIRYNIGLMMIFVVVSKALARCLINAIFPFLVRRSLLFSQEALLVPEFSLWALVSPTCAAQVLPMMLV